MKDIKKLFGQRVRELRKTRNYTQEQLAEKVGINTANISYIETGKFSPSVETLAKLSEVLQVHLHELYMFEHLKPVDELRDELINALNDNEELIRLLYKFYQSVK